MRSHGHMPSSPLIFAGRHSSKSVSCCLLRLKRPEGLNRRNCLQLSKTSRYRQRSNIPASPPLGESVERPFFLLFLSFFLFFAFEGTRIDPARDRTSSIIASSSCCTVRLSSILRRRLRGCLSPIGSASSRGVASKSRKSSVLPK